LRKEPREYPVSGGSCRFGGFTSRREEVNGQPGALLYDPEGRLITVMILNVAEGQIRA
jgi:hypothetical protein